MKKLEPTVSATRIPRIESMYMFLFHCFDIWEKSDQSMSAYFKSKGRPPKEIPPLRDASRYSIIIGAYSLLDAVIHSYVSMHKFQTDEKDDNHTVYSKWKNFPYKVEGVAFKKSDILIIDQIRLIRNQIAHPKAKIHLPVSEIGAGPRLEILKSATGPVTSSINFNPQFSKSNSVFLLNEITRLLVLAESTLSNVSFIPKEKIYMQDQRGTSGVMWPENIDVI